MAKNLVESIYKENAEIAAFLQQENQISYLAAVENSFRKVLLLAAASYFEALLTEAVLAFLSGQLKANHPLFKIVKTKGIDRQYHAWFKWDASNANQFFGMFGDDFKAFMREKIAVDPLLERGIKAFLELGALRNGLVHQNFAEFTVEKTPTEIYALYRDAVVFVYGVAGNLSEFSASIE